VTLWTASPQGANGCERIAISPVYRALEFGSVGVAWAHYLRQFTQGSAYAPPWAIPNVTPLGFKSAAPLNGKLGRPNSRNYSVIDKARAEYCCSRMIMSPYAPNRNVP